MKNIIILALIATLFTSCEKVIDLNLANVDSKLIIEANITDLPGPYYVKLTKSVNFDQSNNYPAVTDAIVVISDNTGVIDTLINKGTGVYETSKIQGIEGRTYSLNVIAEGKSYAAISKMPNKVNLDSLRLNIFKFAGTTQNTVIPVFTDPSTLGNNYRFVMYVNNVLDKSYVLWNDDVNNGKVNERPLRTNDIEIESGNNVSIEMQCVDQTAYLYYLTLSQMAGGGPGGGTTPSNPPNGISGGALGLFSAHTAQKQSILIP